MHTSSDESFQIARFFFRCRDTLYGSHPFRILLLCSLLCLPVHRAAFSQGKPFFYQRSPLYLSIVPGVGTHGVNPGEYINRFAFNLFSGYSAGNTVFEVSGLSNFSQSRVSGLQIAGLVNVVGGNRFAGLPAPEKQKLLKEQPEATVNGIQFAAAANLTNGSVFGWQTTGGINLVSGSLDGFQLAGVANVVSDFSFGVQLAGLANVSIASLDGLQVSALLNYTSGELHGIQLGLFNIAGKIEGRRSVPSAGHTGLQLGLVNNAARMNGYQVGFINSAKEMAGTQIGLINVMKKNLGTTIGLINIPSKEGHMRVFASEMFLTNVEVSTGSPKAQNMLSVSYNPAVLFYKEKPSWAFGYALGKVKYGPAGLTVPKQFFLNYDVGVSHVNRTMGLTRNLSLLTRVRGGAGKKIVLGRIPVYLFGGLTLNGFLYDYNDDSTANGLSLYKRQYDNFNLAVWLGANAGVHFH